MYDLEQAILKGCDVDGNGRIDRRELAVILLAILNSNVQGKLSVESSNVHRRRGNLFCSTHSQEQQESLRMLRRNTIAVCLTDARASISCHT